LLLLLLVVLWWLCPWLAAAAEGALRKRFVVTVLCCVWLQVLSNPCQLASSQAAVEGVRTFVGACVSTAAADCIEATLQTCCILSNRGEASAIN
jgi:hypothetical protein